MKWEFWEDRTSISLLGFRGRGKHNPSLVLLSSELIERQENKRKVLLLTEAGLREGSGVQC